MVTNNIPFPTYAMHCFNNEISIAQNRHQKSFGCHNLLGMVVQCFLNNPVGNLILYASITELVGDKVETPSETVASLANEWFYRGSIYHEEGRFEASTDLLALLVHSSWFWNFFLDFNYDHAKYNEQHTRTIRWMLLGTRRIEVDLLERLFHVDPLCYFVLHLIPVEGESSSDRRTRDRLSLVALSGSLEQLTVGLRLKSSLRSDCRSYFNYCDMFRRTLEASLDTGSIFRTTLDSGLIENSVLNQGDDTALGYVQLIGMFAGVPTEPEQTLMLQAYKNLERLYDLYAIHRIADAPKKRDAPRCSCGECPCTRTYARSPVDLWTLVRAIEEGSTNHLPFALGSTGSPNSPNRPTALLSFFDCVDAEEDALVIVPSVPSFPGFFECSEEEESTKTNTPAKPPTSFCWLCIVCGVRLCIVVYLCWSYASSVTAVSP